MRFAATAPLFVEVAPFSSQAKITKEALLEQLRADEERKEAMEAEPFSTFASEQIAT